MNRLPTNRLLPYRLLPNRLLIGCALLALSSAASAAAVWGSVGLTTRSTTVGAGFAILPLPILGPVGVEGELERPFNGSGNVFSLGATLHEINLPLTSLGGFVGAGLSFSGAVSSSTASSTARTYLEGGLYTSLLGPVGLKVDVRGYGGGGLRAGVGAEIRF